MLNLAVASPGVGNPLSPTLRAAAAFPPCAVAAAPPAIPLARWGCLVP